jgi:hypothetical protein
MAYRMLPANARMRKQTTQPMSEEMPEVSPEDVAEDQEKPELQAVKDFVNNLDDTQFGYLQECIQKRLDAGMDEVDKADAKPAEMVFDEMETENENTQKLRNE